MEKHEGEWAAGPEGHSWVRVASAVPPGARPGCGKTDGRGGGDRKGTGGEGAEGRALRPDPCLTVCPEAAARGRPGRC